jgi:hypothetical protein
MLRPSLGVNPGDPIPPGYYVTTEKRTGLLAGGGVLLGLGYLGAAIGAGIQQAPLVAIPVAGPWIYGIASLAGGGSMGGTFGFVYLLDGVAQAVGLGLLIGGLSSGRTVIRTGVKEAKTWWLPTPMRFGNGGVGLGIVGTL